MDILQGALAFAVAMILFATVVSGVSEGALRLMKRRPQTLARMMGVFVDQEITRRLRATVVARNPAAFGAPEPGESGSGKPPLGEDAKWKEFTATHSDDRRRNTGYRACSNAGASCPSGGAPLAKGRRGRRADDLWVLTAARQNRNRTGDHRTCRADQRAGAGR